jgi:ectoine hydroxylase-related dioxygenase (phytanoyl-CoA dioxygenase family)
MAFRISEEQRNLYREEGYMFLERALPERDLEVLRSECSSLVAEQDAEMDRTGSNEINLSRRNSRYFVFLASKKRAKLAEFLYNDIMAEICRATIGDKAFLFWEQFVVKGTDTRGASFGWHQDSGYVDRDHTPYVNAWIPLDDVSEENGTISVIPFSRAGTRVKVEHKPDPNSKDRIGYFGNDPGIPFIAPAGSIAIFSSVSFHRSGPNFTPNMRRAYSIQYSPDVVLDKDGSLKGLADPFLVKGERVR